MPISGSQVFDLSQSVVTSTTPSENDDVIVSSTIIDESAVDEKKTELNDVAESMD